MELRDPTPMYYAQPLEDNLFEWHFTILAPQGTDYEGGRYHGRIILPTEYPMKPPSIIMLTVFENSWFKRPRYDAVLHFFQSLMEGLKSTIRYV